MSYTCDKCGNEFEQPIMVDSGGEYGGLPHTYPVSPCCESDFEEPEKHENGNNVKTLGEEADLEAQTFSLTQKPTGSTNVEFRT